ncbi:hypothetical protein [Mycobacteroides abscessus]|uniref:hypothetical protein n=1 Tax=Mycobacteroides abscessus TaxID=36809 RepID=UPI0007F971FA|nr:hypothetical protein [Mycobacteroides abscessus]ANO12791.1 hypothetical protein BAB77_02020 [Mycobacteroides abscessus]ARQ63043.1 hypothetical protein CAK77_02200 [Mycobacteroides abscessus subsp. massiliense]MBE5447544.1 hypothetical protein [Mycobacteroides abscessus]MBE5514165.1 hypothetical protein [Mycobacteroides abscessus]MBN7511787.1 hypothetical protein [Mycobacteroides abscessus subsp. massiliense]
MTARLVVIAAVAIAFIAGIAAAVMILTGDDAADAVTAAAVPVNPEKVSVTRHVETTMTSDAIESAYAAVQAFKQQDTGRTCTQISPLAKRCD